MYTMGMSEVQIRRPGTRYFVGEVRVPESEVQASGVRDQRDKIWRAMGFDGDVNREMGNVTSPEVIVVMVDEWLSREGRESQLHGRLRGEHVVNAKEEGFSDDGVSHMTGMSGIVGNLDKYNSVGIHTVDFSKINGGYGDSNDAIVGLRMAMELGDIICAPWGFDLEETPESVREVVFEAIDRRKVILASTGNDGRNWVDGAANMGVVGGIGAINYDFNARAEFSNYDAAGRGGVSLLAPGDGIPDGLGYSWVGTSTGPGEVAIVMAMVMRRYGVDAREAYDLVRNGAERSVFQGYNMEEHGYGLVSVRGAIFGSDNEGEGVGSASEVDNNIYIPVFSV